MKESEAREILNKLLVALQKFRSMAAEELPQEILTLVSGTSMHWTVGGDMLDALVKALDKSPLEPSEFYNFMTIATSLATETPILFEYLTGERLPAPDLKILADGWEPEESTGEEWSIGWERETTTGGWRNITTVHAASEAEAQAEGERVLNRPGRYGHWTEWKKRGRQVRRKRASDERLP